MDVDLIVAADAENEARVFAAVSTLPDHAALELQPGELWHITSSAWPTRSSWT